MNIMSFFVLLLVVLIPNKSLCDSVEANYDIGGFQFELLLTHLADFQTFLEDRYESSLSQITSILEQFESRMEKRIGLVEDKIDAFNHNTEYRYESSDKILQSLHKKVDTLEYHIENNTSRIITRIEQYEAKVDGLESRIGKRVEKLEGERDTFKALMEDQLNGKFDTLESHMGKRFDNSTSQIMARISQTESKVGGVESQVKNRIEKVALKIDAFKTVTEDRHKTSNSILGRCEAKVDTLKLHMENRITNSTSQIMARISQTEAKVGGVESQVKNRIEQVALKIDAFKTVTEDRHKTSNSILGRCEGKVDTLKLHMENRIANSTSQIITKMNQNEAKVDEFESRTAQRISQSSSQIIDTFGRQIEEADSNLANRIETSSLEFVEMMRNLHTKVNVLESRMKDYHDTTSVSAERSDERDYDVYDVTSNHPYQSSRNHLDNYVQNLRISTFRNPWTTIQQRFNGSVDFYRNWNAYKNGFGQQRGEFWIGLEKLYQMTRSAQHELLIVLEDFDGIIKHALYEDFKIGSENENYTIRRLGEYSGTAENSFYPHVGTQFSTYDRDNDERPYRNCAKDLQGGWWFRSDVDCIVCNLNGKYYQQPEVQDIQGLNWCHWYGDYYSLKSTKMMIRRRSMTAG